MKSNLLNPVPDRAYWAAVFSLFMGVTSLIAAEFIPVSLLTAIAQELNISRETLKRWKQEYNAGKFSGDTPNSKIRSAEQEEIIRLKKALYESNLERDILKKAVSIFSKSDR